MPVDRWSTAQVLAVAPDPAAARSARSVSGAAKWSVTGLTGEVLWGLCKGSGKNPYQVCVDLSGPAYRCSCPSRKFPCKHALGLLLLWAETGVADAPAPDWVAQWQAGRAARAARAAAPRAASGPADPAAAARRVEQRATRIAAGLDELRRWLDDQAEQGLSGADQRGSAPFEAMAARLVDAQAPTVAATLRRAGRTVGVGSRWLDRLCGELGLLRLLVSAHERIDTLPDDLAATVRTRIGYPTATEDVLATPPVRDRWQILGQVDSADDKLSTRRIWLRGADSGRYALVLAFAAPGQSFPADLVPGTQIDADLCFYPGQPALRALVAARHGAPVPVTAPVGAVDMRAALADYAAALAADTWRESVPVLLAGVVPSRDGHLIDPSGAALPLAPGHEQPRWLLAAAGGEPVDLAAELGPTGLRPLAAWSHGRFVAAGAAEPAHPGGPVAELPAELVAAALLGTARRPWSGDLTVGGRSITVGGEGAGGLLTAAAVALTNRRAGLTPSTGHEPVPVAPAESTPPVSAAATVRLRALLTTGGAPGDAETRQELLAEWLRLADRQGGRVPTDLLPALLDAGRRHRALRPLLARVCGHRGPWLAALYPTWGYLLDEAGRPDDEPIDPVVWETGTPGERVDYLTRLRASDPDGAREVLAAGFTAEKPDDRAALLAALEVGLAQADEPFLEAALDDRRKEVRVQARQLLDELPDSSLRRRMVDRATRWVQLDPDDKTLLVQPPTECDPQMVRDGMNTRPISGGGDRAWWLEQALSWTPVAVWHTTMDRPPAELVALAVGHDWDAPLLSGWARAALRDRSTDWAQALVAVSWAVRNTKQAVLPVGLVHRLFALLPAEQQVDLTLDALRGDPDQVIGLLSVLPAEAWSTRLTSAVGDTVADWYRARQHSSYRFARFCRAAAAILPPTLADRFREIADGPIGEEAEPGRAHAMAQLATVIAFRSEMHKEFA